MQMKKLLMFSSIAAIVAGFVLVAGGLWGMSFTYANVVRESIITPKDAAFPEVSVRGPLTLKVEADIIRKHTLKLTEGKTFAQMPREIPKLNGDGSPLLDAEGKPMMEQNTARDIWITATTLITALNMGILAYAFFGMVLLAGLISLWTGFVFWMLGKEIAMKSKPFTNI